MNRIAKRLWIVSLVSLAAGVAGSAGGKAASDPLAPRAYLDHALATMRADALYAPAVDWPAVTAEAHKMAAKSTATSGTYPAIKYALDALETAGDLHIGFFTAPEWKQYMLPTIADAPSPAPTVSLVRGRLGLIAPTGIGTLPTSPNSRNYVRSALTRISSLQTKHHPCGWIVDLRADTGGDMYPMLLAVGPILGEGRLIGFTGRKGFQYYVSYRDSTLSGGGYTVRAPLEVPDVTPAPPVAVLTSQLTASSGEVVTVAFRGRAHTRSFGSHTMGATTAPATYEQADGVVIRFAVSYYVDRGGTVYRDPIKPDVPVAAFRFATPTLSVQRAAEKWLMSTPACSQTH